MTLVALPCAVVSYSTCELVTCGTVTPGAGTRWEGKGVILYITYIYIYVYIYSCKAVTQGSYNCDVLYNVMQLLGKELGGKERCDGTYT